MTRRAGRRGRRDIRIRTVAVRRIGMLVYGMALALFTARQLRALLPDTLTMESFRAAGAAAGIAAQNHGAPALVGLAGGHFSPVGISDDPGFYAYTGWLGHWLHVSDPVTILRWWYVIFYALIVLVAPLVFFELFDSLLVGIVAPLVLSEGLHLLNDTDIYWITAWAVIFLLPLVFLVATKPWRRWSVAALAAVMVAASFANSVRANAGLPVLISGLIVVVLRQRGWLRRVGIAAVLAAAYFVVTPLGFIPITNARDHFLHENVTAQYPTTHPAWHVMYIGLGYIPNTYGIWWFDGVGFHKAEEYDPGVAPNTRRYAADVRRLYFHMVRDHPGFVLRGYWAKTKVLLASTYRHAPEILVFLPLMLAFGSRRRQFRLYSLLTLPALLIGALPPILTIPAPEYQIGFLAAVALLLVLAVCWLVLFVKEDARDAVHRLDIDALRTRSALISQARRGAWVLPALAVAGALTILFFHIPKSDAKPRYITPRQAGVISSPAEPAGLSKLRTVRGSEVVSWSFRGGTPAVWRTANGGTSEPKSRGVQVTTGTGGRDRVLLGPATTLPPGSYSAIANAVVRQGGLSLGVVDARTNALLGTSHYWFLQNFADGFPTTVFVLRRPVTVRLVLSNWRRRNVSSTWLIRRAALTRTPS